MNCNGTTAIKSNPDARKKPGNFSRMETMESEFLPRRSRRCPRLPSARSRLGQDLGDPEPQTLGLGLVHLRREGRELGVPFG